MNPFRRSFKNWFEPDAILTKREKIASVIQVLATQNHGMQLTDIPTIKFSKKRKHSASSCDEYAPSMALKKYSGEEI